MRRSGTRVVSDCGRDCQRDCRRNRRWRGGLALGLLLSLATAPVAEAAKGDSEARAQLAFGVDMARRGLWNEALFRFEQVRTLQPNDPKVLNNLAVAYEAVGRFDDAEAAYREALKVAPSNRDLKKNVTRFREFLQSFRAKKSTAESLAPAAPAALSDKPKEGR